MPLNFASDAQPVYFLFPAACFLFAAAALVRNVWARIAFRRAVGIVVGYELASVESAEDAAYRMTVRFKDADGKTRTGMTPMRTGFFTRRPGESVPIFYRREGEGMIRIASFAEFWLPVLIPGSLGVLFLLALRA